MPREATVQQKAAARAAGIDSTTRHEIVHPLQIKSLGEFLRGFEPPEDLVEGLMRAGWFYSWTAPTGHAKTAAAVLLALCIASGRPFAGREVKAGRVLYCAGENPDDVRARFIVTAERLGFDLEQVQDRVQILEARFDIGSRLHELVAILKDNADDPFVLLVIDTDAAYAGSEDENSNAERVQHARNLRTLTLARPRPTVVDLCHPPKGAGRDSLVPRGGGAFVAEVDGNFGLWLDGEVAEMFISGKHRGPPFSPIQLRKFEGTSQRLRDKKGRQMQVPYVDALDDLGSVKQGAAEVEDRIAVLRQIQKTSRASLAEMAKQLGWFFKDGTTPDKSRVQRNVASLTSARAISRNEVTREFVVQKLGKDALKSYR